MVRTLEMSEQSITEYTENMRTRYGLPFRTRAQHRPRRSGIP